MILCLTCSNENALIHPGYYYDFETERFAFSSLLTEPAVLEERINRLLEIYNYSIRCRPYGANIYISYFLFDVAPMGLNYFRFLILFDVAPTGLTSFCFPILFDAAPMGLTSFCFPILFDAAPMGFKAIFNCQSSIFNFIFMSSRWGLTFIFRISYSMTPRWGYFVLICISKAAG